MGPSPVARLALAIAIAFLAGAACAGEDDDPPIEPEGELALGGAALDGSGFVELGDGEPIELVPGSQGGFHIWTGIRVRGVEGELFLDREVRRLEDDTLVLSAPGQYLEVSAPDADQWWERATAAPSFMCPAPVGIQIFDTELVLTGRLTDAAGELLAEDSVVVIPTCPAGEQEAFCYQVCDG